MNSKKNRRNSKKIRRKTSTKKRQTGGKINKSAWNNIIKYSLVPNMMEGGSKNKNKKRNIKKFNKNL